MLSKFGASITNDYEVTAYRLQAVGDEAGGRCLASHANTKVYLHDTCSDVNNGEERVVLSKVGDDVRFYIIHNAHEGWILEGPIGFMKNGNTGYNKGHADVLQSNTRSWAIYPEGTIR
jgi:hypothetical protein